MGRESAPAGLAVVVVAVVVAATTLGRLDYAAFILAYYITQMTLTLGVVGWLRNLSGQELRADAS